MLFSELITSAKPRNDEQNDKKITDEAEAPPVKVWIRVYILSEKDFYAFGPNFKPNSIPTLIVE